MSLSYQKLKPIRITDPITDVNAVTSYAILEGGSKISYKAYTSTSISSSSIQFSCPPPSGNIIVNRRVMAHVPIRLTITGRVITSNGAFVPNSVLLNQNFDAPRQFPFSQGLDSLQVGINNDSVSINMSDVVGTLLRYNIDDKLRTREYSMSPNYPDQSFNYADLQGTNRNPLGNYANGHQGDAIPRGGFPFVLVANPVVVPAVAPGTSAVAIVDFFVCEELFLSPFFWGCEGNNNQGFYNVNSMDFNLTFLAQCGFRMWSHSAAPIATSGAITVTSVIDSISVQFNGFAPAFSYPSHSMPQLLFEYYTPNLLTKQQLSPNLPISYSYFDILRFPSDLGTMTFASGVNIVQSNNIQLNQIPRRMYIFGRPSNAVLQSRADITDTFLVINSVSIQWANQSTLLSSATQNQLFMENVKNHSEQSWNEWSGLGLQNSAFLGTAGASLFGATGGPLCLSFGDTIQLESNECPGMQGQYQIQVQVGLSNMNSSGSWDNLQMSLYLVFAMEGVLTISQLGACVHQLGVVSKMDVLEVQDQPGLNYRDVQRVNGGDFLDSLANFGSRINEFLKSSKLISTVSGLIPHPLGQVGSQVARSLGYGYEGGCEEGGIAIGGKRMSKKEIRKTLMSR